MELSDNIIAVIPARGGSKRIIGKNKRLFCGKPLVQWTIDVAVESGIDTILTSDDSDILSLSNRIMNRRRPDKLATADANQYDVAMDAIQHLREIGKTYTHIMLLQPTSPLRTVDDITGAISSLCGYKSIASVSFCQEFPHDLIDNDGNMLSCQQGIYYYINGAIYICEIEWLMNRKTFYVPRETGLYIMPKYRGIDIDDEGDWEVAEKIMRSIMDEKRTAI